jgi:hypothetical protein
MSEPSAIMMRDQLEQHSLGATEAKIGNDMQNAYHAG